MIHARPSPTQFRNEPGKFFAALWQAVEARTGDLFTDEWEGRRAPECVVLAEILRSHDGDGIPGSVIEYLDGGWRGRTDIPATARERRMFVVMCALDDACQYIHPAVLIWGAGTAALPPLGGLLQRMAEDYRVDGHFGILDGLGAVLPKGQLLRRHQPGEDADASGDCLDSQFAFLSVVRLHSPAHHIQFGAIPPSAVTPRPIQRVGVAAIAEDADDISFRAHLRNGQERLHAEPAASVAERAVRAIANLAEDRVDLAVLPELVVTPEAVAAIGEELACRAEAGADTPALSVLGSGLSEERDGNGLGHNRCIIVNARGEELWRQDKCHHFSMDPVEHMEPCGIAPCGPKKHREDTRTGSVLHVRDLPGIGRVAVLICEDLEQPYPGDLLRDIRPDWIVTPVLDRGLGIARWTLTRCGELGRKSMAHMVVATSTTLTVRQQKTATLAEARALAPINIGLLRAGGPDRRFTLLAAGSTDPCTAYAEWEPDTWPQHGNAEIPPGGKR